jgi:hypothetical protein
MARDYSGISVLILAAVSSERLSLHVVKVEVDRQLHKGHAPGRFKACGPGGKFRLPRPIPIRVKLSMLEILFALIRSQSAEAARDGDASLKVVLSNRPRALMCFYRHGRLRV